MSCAKLLRISGLGESIACAALVCLLSMAARGEDLGSKSAAAQGNVDFDYADAPPAVVELDLSQGMFHDLFGIGDAAVAGVADALAQSAGTKSGAEGAKMAAEELAVARQIVQITGQVVQGVRVRVYQGVNGQSDKTDKLLSHYDDKLRTENWQAILRAHYKDQMVTVWTFRNSGAIKGLFVVAAANGNLVLTNVVCDVSPENVQKLTTAATNIALQAGIGKMIEAKLHKLPAPPPAPPTGAPANQP